MKRRTFIAACSGLGTTTVAGCADTDDPESDQSNSDPDPESGFDPEIKSDLPTLELLATEVDAEQVLYNDEFTILATFANVGAEPTQEGEHGSIPQMEVLYTGAGQDFDDDTQLATGELDLDPKEMTTIPMGPFHAPVTGTWEINAEEWVPYLRDGTELEIEVQPRSLSIGDSFEVKEDVLLTVENVELRNSFFFEYSPFSDWTRTRSIGLETAPDGQLFVLTEMTVENNRSVITDIEATPQPNRLDTSQFSIEPTTPYTLPDAVEIDIQLPGQKIDGLRVGSGETASVWQLETIDIERLDEMQFEFQGRPNTGSPEVTVDADDVSYPEFELVEFIVPDERRRERQPFGAVVQNVGTAPGTFRGLVQYDRFDEELVDPEPDWELEQYIEPSETVEVTTEYTSLVGSEFRLQPFDVTASASLE